MGNILHPTHVVDERECYEGEVQPYRKTDYKPIMYSVWNVKMNCGMNFFRITALKRRHELAFLQCGVILFVLVSTC